MGTDLDERPGQNEGEEGGRVADGRTVREPAQQVEEEQVRERHDPQHPEGQALDAERCRPGGVEDVREPFVIEPGHSLADVRPGLGAHDSPAFEDEPPGGEVPPDVLRLHAMEGERQE
jgi:hypothetical protein